MATFDVDTLSITKGSDTYYLDAKSVIVCDSEEDFPATGVAGKIYVAEDSNAVYRWDNTLSEYVSIADTNVMTGATASTAGTKGLVPAPAAGKDVQYLKGDGTWDSPALSELGFSVVNGKVCVTYQKEVE